MNCKTGNLGLRDTVKVISVEAGEVFETGSLSKASKSACLKHNYCYLSILGWISNCLSIYAILLTDCAAMSYCILFGIKYAGN